MMHRFSVGSVAMLSYGKLIWYSLLAFSGPDLAHGDLADTLAYLTIYVFLRVMYHRHCTVDAAARATTHHGGAQEAAAIRPFQ